MLSKLCGCLVVLFIAFAQAVPLKAFAQTTPGVQQSTAKSAVITGIVVDSKSSPVANADVQFSGPAVLSTTTDPHGTFVFIAAPYGTYRIVVRASGLGVATRDNVVVNGDSNVSIQFSAQSTAGLKTIAVVSTTGSGAKINMTPASIAAITPSDYAFEGNTSWRGILDEVPGVSVSDQAGGNTTSGIIPDSPFQPIILSINGALAYETSSSLDGMPLYTFSLNTFPGGGDDLSFLPMGMFDTADIVRGPGANSPTIVDSIGGSFVLHPPGNVEHNTAEVALGYDQYGGTVFNSKIAARAGRLSAVLSYGFNDSPGPIPYADILALGFSIPPSTIGGKNVVSCGPPAGSACQNYITNGPSPGYLNCYCGEQTSLLYGSIPMSTAWIQHTGAISLAYALTPSLTAQFFYAGQRSSMAQPGFQSQVNFTPGPGYHGSIAPGIHTYILPYGYNPYIAQASSLMEEKVTDYVGQGVIRIAALQLNSYLTQNYAGNSSPPSGTYNVWGTAYVGNSAPGVLKAYNGGPQGLSFPGSAYSSAFWTNSRDLLLNYSTAVGDRGSVGTSYVTTYYNNPYWYQSAYGSYTSRGGQSNAVSQTTNEFRINGTLDVTPHVSLDGSWYFTQANYHVTNPASTTPGFWSNANFQYNAPRLSAVWHPNNNIAYRVAAGGGYALPALIQLVGNNSAPQCSAGSCLQTLVNLNLKPEQSFGFDVGTDIRLHRNTAISFDLYRTNLFGQFYSSTTVTGTYHGLPLYTGQYNNLAQSRYEGMNLSIRHDVPLGWYWSGALGLTRGYVVSVPAGFYDQPGAPKSVNTYIVPGINFDGYQTSAVPYANGAAQIGYRWRPDTYLDISPTYYGNNNQYYYPAFVEFDVHGGIAITKHLSLLATFRNVSNIHGQNYQLFVPTLAAPTVAGLPAPLFGLPYGPKALTMTMNIK